MTKEEIIKEAYGELGIPFNENITSNGGWTRIKPMQFSLKYDDLDLLKLGNSVHSIRPKSLAGIEDNNGWIKIKDESDLPKESSAYWIMQSDGLINTMKEYEQNKQYYRIIATHYQPIIKPKPPVY